MPTFCFEFEISRVDDRQVVDVVARIREEISWTATEVSLSFPFDAPPVVCKVDRLAKDTELSEVLDSRLNLISRFLYRFANSRSLIITRGGEQERTDKVAIRSNWPESPMQFARVVSAVKRHFNALSPAGFVESLVGQDAARQSEAREAALARLEATAAHLLTESEQARKRWEAEYRRKEKELLQEIRERSERLDAECRERESQLQAWRDELDRRDRELSARCGRHQLGERLNAKLADYSAGLELSRGARRLRRTVSWFAVILMLLFGGAATYYLVDAFSARASTDFAVAAVKQAVFLTLFVATSVFFVRWQGRWFERRAAEELYFRRCEIEIDRTGWMIETAFEWKERYQTEIPADLLAGLPTGPPSTKSTESGDPEILPPHLTSALSEESDDIRIEPIDTPGLCLGRTDVDEEVELKPR